MTEAEWVANANPIRMVEHLKGNVSGRKLRLFTNGCTRLFQKYFNDGPARLLVDTFEEYADDRAVYDDVVALREPVERLARSVVSSSAARVVLEMLIDLTQRERYGPNAYWLARVTVSEVGRVVIFARSEPESNDDVMQRSVRRAAAVVREIFGNPFRVLPFANEWRTTTVVLIAKQMYESRDFSAMPILADALQDAGCDSDDILTHCRDEKQVHVRGCWVVDLVLGKE